MAPLRACAPLRYLGGRQLCWSWRVVCVGRASRRRGPSPINFCPPGTAVLSIAAVGGIIIYQAKEPHTPFHIGTMLSPHTAPMSNTTVTPRDTAMEHTLEVVRWRSASWVSRTDVALCSLCWQLNTYIHGGQPKTVCDRKPESSGIDPPDAIARCACVMPVTRTLSAVRVLSAVWCRPRCVCVCSLLQSSKCSAKSAVCVLLMKKRKEGV